MMATPDKTTTAPHLLVVIDHQEAKVYRTELVGAVPERIAPYDPHGHGRNLHSAQAGVRSVAPAPKKTSGA